MREPQLGVKYTSNGPFQDISIDPLDYHLIKPFEGSRSTVKNYPMVVHCLNSGALEVLLMEVMETNDIILCFLKLELRHGPKTMISRDSRTNLLTNNINPRIQLTVETPCNFNDGKLPVLDVVVNVNEKEQNRIDF